MLWNRDVDFFPEIQKKKKKKVSLSLEWALKLMNSRFCVVWVGMNQRV